MKITTKSAYEAPASAVLSLQPYSMILQSAGGGGEQGGGDSMDAPPLFEGGDILFPF